MKSKVLFLKFYIRIIQQILMHYSLNIKLYIMIQTDS